MAAVLKWLSENDMAEVADEFLRVTGFHAVSELCGVTAEHLHVSAFRGRTRALFVSVLGVGLDVGSKSRRRVNLSRAAARRRAAFASRWWPP